MMFISVLLKSSTWTIASYCFDKCWVSNVKDDNNNSICIVMTSSFIYINLLIPLSLVAMVQLDTRVHHTTILSIKFYRLLASSSHVILHVIKNSNAATICMKPRKQIITLHNNHCLISFIQSAIGLLLDSRNAPTASKPNCACVYYHPKMTETILSTSCVHTNH